jgi:tetratricopeptide (TPR) repeat protein
MAEKLDMLVKASRCFVMLMSVVLFAEGLAVDDPFRHWLFIIFAPFMFGMNVYALVRKPSAKPSTPEFTRRGAIFGSMMIVAIPLIIVIPAIFFSGDKLGDRCSNLKDPETAITACQEIIHSKKLSPADLAKVLNNLGSVYYHKGQFDEAMTNYNDAILSSPNYAIAYMNRCGVFLAKRDFPSAIKDCADSIRLDPHVPMTYLARGGAYVGNRQFEDALADFDHVLTLQPKNSLAFNARCDAHNLLGQTDLALADCNEALALSPKDANTFDTRGFVYLKVGNYAAARADFDAAIKIDGKQSTSLYGRGLIRKHDGDTVGANADIADSVKINPHVAEDIALYGLAE